MGPRIRATLCKRCGKPYKHCECGICEVCGTKKTYKGCGCGRVCRACGETKPIGSFYVCKNGYYYSYCDACHTALSKERGYGWQRRYNLKRKYGMTPEQHEALAAQQNHVCAICGQANIGGYPLVVDHDHQTGEVRGLLCFCCNRMLGQAHNSPRVLRAGAIFLEQSPPSRSCSEV